MKRRMSSRCYACPLKKCSAPSSMSTPSRSIGNPREFLQAEKEDQEMAEACKRLIKMSHRLQQFLPDPTGKLHRRFPPCSLHSLR